MTPRRNRSTFLRRALLTNLAFLTLAACGGAEATRQSPNPVPVISAASPARIEPGSGPTTVTLSGTGFVSSSHVQWAGQAWPSYFVNESTLTFVLPVSELTGVLSRATVTVTNDEPGGGVSNPISVYVQRAAPVISSVTPSSVVLGNGSFNGIVTVTGQNFTMFSLVTIDHTVLTPKSFSATQLVLDVGFPSQVLSRPGVFEVSVSNRDPFTPESNRVNITVSAP